MNNERQVRYLLNCIVFSAYIIILVYLVIFKGPIIFKVVSPIDYTLNEMNQDQPGPRSYNLIPLRTIKSYYKEEFYFLSSSLVSNVFGNVILFMPFGFLYPLVFRKATSFQQVVLATVILSLGFELMQFATNTGFCDIDDFMLNTIGGMIGYAFYAFLYKW